MIVADADFVPSVTEVAVTVTELEGTADGAMKVVAAPLPLLVGLNDPHAELGVQLQVTPALAESLLTVAVTAEEPFTVILVGGGVLMATLIAGGGGGGGVLLLLPPPHATSRAAMESAEIVAIV